MTTEDGVVANDAKSLKPSKLKLICVTFSIKIFVLFL